ncbi:MAG: Fis family transcriptional regulator [Cyanobacteria bacterium QH_1_48_107]|nr:MAG: Fis family transcriptional regulator [Cyanobacteria bacterium QH_1_48_107]
MDDRQRDRFELLSAYLDGEASAAERKQVQQWLETDPEMQRLYARALKLSQGIQTMPLPEQEKSSRPVPEQVFQRADRHRLRRAVVWGGGAIAALFVGAVWSLLPTNNYPVSQVAQSPKNNTNSELQLVVNRPAVEIPQTRLIYPEPLLKPTAENPGVSDSNYE